MTRFLKLLHLVGVAAFLGSIFGHILLGLALPWSHDPAAVQFARDGVRDATMAVTLPGLALTVLTGLLLARARPVGQGGGLRGSPWLMLHASLGALIVANALLVVVPAGAELAAAVSSLGTDRFDAVAHLNAKIREDVAGAVNVLLTLVTMAVAIAKPRLRRYGAPARPAT